MKLYDPAASIVYVHLASQVPRSSAAARLDDGMLARLPGGYANQSPRTRVRRDTGASRGGPEPVGGVRSGGGLLVDC